MEASIVGFVAGRPSCRQLRAAYIQYAFHIGSPKDPQEHAHMPAVEEACMACKAGQLSAVNACRAMSETLLSVSIGGALLGLHCWRPPAALPYSSTPSSSSSCCWKSSRAPVQVHLEAIQSQPDLPWCMSLGLNSECTTHHRLMCKRVHSPSF